MKKITEQEYDAIRESWRGWILDVDAGPTSDGYRCMVNDPDTGAFRYGFLRRHGKTVYYGPASE